MGLTTPWVDVGGLSELDLRLCEGSSVLVQGPAGVGKTAMVRRLAELHLARGKRVRFVTTPPRSSLSSSPRGLAPLIPRTALPNGDYASMVRSAVLAEELDVLIVDDVHELDDISATVVHQMVHNDPLSVVLVARTPGVLPDAIADLIRDGGVAVLTAQPWPRTKAVELAEVLLGGRLLPSSGDLLCDMARGNPLFVKELISGSMTSGTLVAADDGGTWMFTATPRTSGRLRDIVWNRIRRLPTEARRLLESLSLVSPLEVYAIGNIPASEVETLADGGFITTVVDGRRNYLEMSHPIYREIVRAEATAFHRRDAADSLVPVLENIGTRRSGDRKRIASLVLERDGSRADADCLLAGAEDALLQRDDELAQTLAVAAFDSSPLEAAMILGPVHSRNGRPDEAEDVLAAAEREAVKSGVAFAAIAELRIRNQMFSRGDTTRARELVDESLGLIEREADRLTIGLLGGMLDAIDGDFSTVIDLYEELPTDPATPPSVRIEGAHWATLGWVLRGDGERALREITEVSGEHQALLRSNPVMAFRLTMNRACALMDQGRLAEAIDLCDRELAEVEPRNLTTSPIWHNLRAIANWMAGSLDGAQSDFKQAQDLLEQGDPSGALPMSLAFSAVVAAERGDRRASSQLLKRATQVRHSQFRHDVFVWWATAWQAALAGDTRGAADLLADWGGRTAERGHRVYASYLLHAAVRLGHPAGVAVMLEQLAKDMDGPLAAAQAAHGTALLAGDHDGLVEAADRFATLGARLWAADCYRQAAALSSQDQHLAARDWLRAAILGDALGPQAPLSPISVRSPGLLTRRQLEVARLAALPTSEIAERLFISVRTVETHLRAIYHKLGIHQREELTALASEPSA